MDITLPEELLLLVHEDASGRPALVGPRLHTALAAAALMELTLAGALEVAEHDGDVPAGRLRRTGQEPADPVLAQVALDAHGRRPKDAVWRVAGMTSFTSRSGELREELLTGLAARGVLRREPARLLGVVPTTSWPTEAGETEDRVRARVREALESPSGAAMDVRTAALVALLSVTGLVRTAAPGLDRRTAERRAKEVADGDWAAAAAKQSVDQLLMLLLTVVLASWVATSAG